MLSADLKNAIQDAYRVVLKNKGFKPRTGQRLMIAEIARTLGCIQEDAAGVRLGESHICVIEAGTGTGKTLSYMLSALPVALAKEKKLVVSTATVMLQEQLVQKDLPDLLRHSGLSFSFAIAKGRGRYICRSKLDILLDINASLGPELTLFEDELAAKLDEPTLKLYQQMLAAIEANTWNGDRDGWNDALSGKQWQPVTTDHRQCTNRQCAYFKDCSYFLARKEIVEADVIVANHDLVLSDLALGGGALLSVPAETIYVFDEAHHLPDKALSHFNYQIRIKASKQWLEQIPKLLAQLTGQVGYSAELDEQLKKLPETQKAIEENLIFALEIVSSIVENSDATDNLQWRFKRGEVPDGLRIIAKNLALQYGRVCVALEAVSDCLLEKSKNDLEVRSVVDRQYPRLALMLGRCHAANMLWQSYAQDESTATSATAPTARWIMKVDTLGQPDYELWSSPIMAADLLSNMLWSACFGAVLTSATLTSVDQFERTKMRMGLPEGTRYKIVPSPFNYNQNATFEVPQGAADPRDADQFTQVLVGQLNKIIEPQKATLVIFTARQQMHAVLKELDESLKPLVIMQDDYSKQMLVKRHCEKIDAGKGSIIFGLASLTEGIDLPGNYLSHVIMAKLPFTVPSDPVEAALNEWLTDLGRNPFWEISVPDAAIRLKQACGRLLRSEEDKGRITLLDKRILTKSYGKAMLDALPDFQRVIG
ncbi:MAG: ATP-dependent DNA helicase DinG [Pseudomonadales bacterium]|nr:ATP-dependent DNA helicase DinG [Pseudomonadales bacterium]MCP5214958.1 ATP-dependent DNA helicase DinG [Pseudomonadales bacterium]